MRLHRLIAILLDTLEQSEAHMDLQRAFGSLESQLPDGYRQDVRTARRRFFFDPTPWWEGVPLSMYLDILRQGVWHSRKIRLRYETAAGEHSTRVVRPYGLVVKAMRWYLVAYCESRGEMRTFNVSRIQRAEILEESFTLPDDFSLESYWRTHTDQWATETTSREDHTSAQG